LLLFFWFHWIAGQFVSPSILLSWLGPFPTSSLLWRIVGSYFSVVLCCLGFLPTSSLPRRIWLIRATATVLHSAFRRHEDGMWCLGRVYGCCTTK
jgi:hypothetical protein